MTEEKQAGSEKYTAKVYSQEWARTRHTNLQRSKTTNKYRVFAHVGGKLVKKVLGLMSENAALKKRDEVLSAARHRLGVSQDARNVTLGALAAVYAANVESDYQLKASSKKYRGETLQQIKDTWPGFDLKPVEAVKESDVKAWAVRAGKRYSATRFNGSLETLRGVFQIGVTMGAITANPALSVDRIPVRVTPNQLPSNEDVQKVLEYLGASDRRKRTLILAKLYYYTGARPFELTFVKKSDVQLERGIVWLRETKNGEPRPVPIFNEAKPIFELLLNDYPGTGPFIPIKTINKSLAKACKAVKVPHMCPYDFRHLFATRCIESGVDVKTLATWMGHKDGGELALTRYAQTRDEHSKKMAEKVRF